MTITLLGQGFEATFENSVGHHLIRLFADKNFHSFHGLTAFTSLAGIKGITKYIRNAEHLNNITIITGVDQQGTSKEALQALVELQINSYVFFLPPPSPIFHPKIYLFEGTGNSELIIGSVNLTAHGLFTNVETSIRLSMDNHIATDRTIVESLKQYYSGLFDYTDPNLKLLTKELIDELVKADIVLTEAQRKELQDKVVKASKAETQNIISKIFPKRAVAQIPKDFRASKKSETPPVKKASSKSIEASNLLWESGPLTERDLNIPKGSTTNPTGSMLFKKGRTEDIDQRHYFRDKVFSPLNWVFDSKAGSTHLEKAAGLFRIVVMGRDYGSFALTLTHNPRINTPNIRTKKFDDFN